MKPWQYNPRTRRPAGVSNTSTKPCRSSPCHQTCNTYRCHRAVMSDRELRCYFGCSSRAYRTSLQLAGELGRGLLLELAARPTALRMRLIGVSCMNCRDTGGGQALFGAIHGGLCSAQTWVGQPAGGFIRQWLCYNAAKSRHSCSV